MSYISGDSADTAPQDLTEIPIREIVLHDTEAVIAQWLLVSCRPTYSAWNVVDVSIYASPGRELPSLIGEDLWHRLPESSRCAVIGKLNEHAHQEREAQARRRRELSLIVNPLAAEAARDAQRAIDYAQNVQSLVLGSLR